MAGAAWMFWTCHFGRAESGRASPHLASYLAADQTRRVQPPYMGQRAAAKQSSSQGCVSPRRSAVPCSTQPWSCLRNASAMSSCYGWRDGGFPSCVRIAGALLASQSTYVMLQPMSTSLIRCRGAVLGAAK